MEGKEVLDQFRGSEYIYEHSMVNGSKLLLTEGCHFVRDVFASNWLFDLIGSYQLQLVNEPFQVWKLTKYKEGCLITCEDGNSARLLHQDVPYTDFPFDITIWQVDGTCLLPSEY